MTYFDNGLEPIDMFRDLWWGFYLRKPLGLETRQPVIDAVSKLGLHILAEDVSDPHYEMIFLDSEWSAYYELSNGDEETAYLWLGAKADTFMPPDSQSARLYADRFLELGKVCYHALRPIYAFAETMNSAMDRADVEAFHITHLYWAQFFGPAFVEYVGDSMLANAPGWRNENLGDSGVLYVLAASPYLYRGVGQHWQQARNYFASYEAPIQWSDQPE